MRTAMLTFVGLLCAAVEMPFVGNCSGNTDVVVSGIGGQRAVHSPSTWSIVDVFVTSESGSGGGSISDVIASVVCAAAVFACVTAPELPGLPIRTETLTLE